jgi:RNA polymerase sigma factor (sigma-70 family)
MSNEIIFYVNPATKDIIYGIEGEDNTNYYSFFGVKEGVLANPDNLSFFDMWFTNTYSLPEVKGFISLKDSEEVFNFRVSEIDGKFDKFLKSTVCGYTSNNKETINFFGKDQDLSHINLVSRFFNRKGFLKDTTQVLLNKEFIGPLSNFLRDAIRDKNKMNVFADIDESIGKENEEVIQLIKEYLGGSSSAGEALLEKYDKLIKSIVNKYTKNYTFDESRKDDFLQEAYIKFLEKLVDFDPASGRLSTFIYHTITGLVRNLLSRESEESKKEITLHGPSGEDEKVTYEKTLEQEREPGVEKIEGDETVDKLLSKLSPREKEVVEMYLYKDMTLQEIGEQLGGLTRERIRQIFEGALAKMRFSLGDVGFGVESSKLDIIFGKDY